MAEPVDPVVRLLLRSPLTPAQRRSASEAFTSSVDEDDLQTKMDALNLPRAVKAELWDLKYAAPKVAPVDAPAGPEGSAVGRFVSNAAEMLNPVAIAKGLYQTVRHPIDTGASILAGQGEQFEKGRSALSEGRYSEAAGHLGAAALPIVGPIAAESGEQIGSGDIAGGLGKATGLLVPLGAASTAKSMVTAMAPARAADALEAGAASRVADVMSPKSASVKGLRMGTKAEKIAPEIAADTSNAAWSKAGFRANIADKLKQSTAALDEASDARLSARTFHTKPIVDALKAKRAQLTAQSVEASQPVREVSPRASAIVDASGKPITVATEKALPVGRDVVPGPNSARVAQIDRAIGELEALGPVARYEPLRRIRAAYDGPASVIYNPAVTPDFLAQQGGALGAADVTSVLRENLAKFDPDTAKANHVYALYKSADDIVSAAAELERSRPKVGRQIMARLTSTLAGGQAAGLPGAAAGYIAGPLVDQATSMGLTAKLQVARVMTDLAKAIRKGDLKLVDSLGLRLKDLRKLAPATATRSMGAREPMPEGTR